jgi:dCTP deaminase
MIKNDIWITEMSQGGMIAPFEPQLVRRVSDLPVISYGLSSYGYDLRLSANEFRIFRHIPGTVVDPKNFSQANLEPATLHSDANGSYFILPAHSYGLGVALERLEIPCNVTALVLNKSTYVRCGVLMPTTVVEAGWKGYLTLEISNASSADARIYADEGIGQLLFFEGDPCTTSYLDRDGKYQNQGNFVTFAKV